MTKWSKKYGYKVDSDWEESLRLGIFKDLEYHPIKLPYTVSHHYHPDWLLKKDSKIIFVEAKGVFRLAAEAAKYVHFAKTLETEYEELVFIFMKPHAEIFFKAKRKDGTIMTHAQWADKNKFRWYDEDTIHELIGSK